MRNSQTANVLFSLLCRHDFLFRAVSCQRGCTSFRCKSGCSWLATRGFEDGQQRSRRLVGYVLTVGVLWVVERINKLGELLIAPKDFFVTDKLIILRRIKNKNGFETYFAPST